MRLHPPGEEPGADGAQGPSAHISEFVGTFLFVLAICGVVSSGAGRAVLTDVALVHPLVLMSLVYAIGSISGWWGCALLDLIRGDHIGGPY